MKKFIVFMLVLGITSLVKANIVSPIQVNDTAAGFEIELPEGMSETVDVNGGYWAIISSSTPLVHTDDLTTAVIRGALTSLAPGTSWILDDAGDSGLFTYGVGIYGFFGDFSVNWSSDPGVYADSFGGTAQYASLFLIDDMFTTATWVMTTPEPATVLLLGLGGLLLRRRK